MEIILVRHPETVAPKGMCYGHLDLDIKDPVEKAKETVLEQLVSAPDLIVSSPLLRAKKLANSLAEHFSLPVFQEDRRLMEMNFGEWEGKLWDELPKEETEKWMNDFVNLNAPNGESFVELQSRVLHFAEEWWLAEQNKLQELGAKRLLIVSHSAPIRVLICHKRQIPLNKAFRMKLDFASVTYL
ncbi:histidine phosphatase superfamily [Leptospira ryugenii]|uniref:Histidine phosphatase superfamily n=1 Tax=Leptospira ryugenii TaxID=1917863 RepID=A0A2P2E4E1_9LEPT|nr:alpha-ribazole phosphatase family protein [Leptospira ryugenii]GBF51755.1 histidine phosphatase superfamily [Leptospira ryugenii]